MNSRSPSRRSGSASTGARTSPSARTSSGRSGSIGGRPGWVLYVAGAAVAAVVAVVIVLASRWYLGTPSGEQFVTDYSGYYSTGEVELGYPGWLNWAHFLNVFLIALIIKTGLQIRSETRPKAYWTPKWNRKRKISLTIWLHQSINLLWVLNGVVFVVLLAVTGYWQRVVPTSWEAFPHALSAGLQYASLNWPTDHQWAHYNGLQELTYFLTIFIAAPLAIATGVRMSGLWPENAARLNRLFPMAVARKTHFVTMIYFCVFIATHVLLVFATGALRNLNKIYTGQDATNWWGLGLFVGSAVLIAAGVLAARAVIVAPVASLFGKVGR